jgi:hypothetical protein
MKITERTKIFGVLFTTVKVMLKFCLGYILGNFFPQTHLVTLLPTPSGIASLVVRLKFFDRKTTDELISGK